VALATFVAWVRAWWSARGPGPAVGAARSGVRELALGWRSSARFVFLGLLQPSPTGMLPAPVGTA
jgi:hypothetical protein